MNVSDILEARYIGQNTWDQFQRIFRKWYPSYVATLNSFDFKPYFEELIKSFNVFYDIAIDHMEEFPDEYSEDEKDPKEWAERWYGLYIEDDILTLHDEISTYEELQKQVPQDALVVITQAIGTWIKQNARELIDAD